MDSQRAPPWIITMRLLRAGQLTMRRESSTTWIRSLAGYRHRDALRDFVERAEAEIHPAAVILFGSLARGDFYSHSDADVCVVLSCAVHPFLADTPDVRGYDPTGIVEPVVFGREQFLQMLRDANPLALEIAVDGVLIAGEAQFAARIEEALAEACARFGLKRHAGGWTFSLAPTAGRPESSP